MCAAVQGSSWSTETERERQIQKKTRYTVGPATLDVYSTSSPYALAELIFKGEHCHFERDTEDEEIRKRLHHVGVHGGGEQGRRRRRGRRVGVEREGGRGWRVHCKVNEERSGEEEETATAEVNNETQRAG